MGAEPCPDSGFHWWKLEDVSLHPLYITNHNHSTLNAESRGLWGGRDLASPYTAHPVGSCRGTSCTSGTERTQRAASGWKISTWVTHLFILQCLQLKKQKLYTVYILYLNSCSMMQLLPPQITHAPIHHLQHLTNTSYQHFDQISSNIT